MRRSYAMVLTACAFFSACCLFAPCVGAWTLYDDFRDRTINPDKWWVSSSGYYNAETHVQESFQGLHLLRRAYGNPGVSEGATAGSLTVYLRDTSPRGILADVTVTDLTVEACPENVSGYLRARIGAYFFNTGNPGDGHINDVWAVVALQRKVDSTDPEDTLTAVSYALVCADSGCSTGEYLGHAELGKVKVGEKVRLRLEWDPTGDRLVTQLNDQPEQAFAYRLDDSLPPRYPDKMLQILHWVPNGQCNLRPTEVVHAVFDNVYIQPIEP